MTQQQPFGDHSTAIDLGSHTLILLSSGSMEVCAKHDESLVLFLDSEETYRLYVSLHAQFQPILLAEHKEARQWDW